jgi:hypothetical protein
VRVVQQVLTRGIICNVEELSSEIFLIADSVLVIAGVPDVPGALVAGCEGIAAFDELDAARCAEVNCRCHEDVDVVGHDGESVEEEFPSVAIAEERGDEELCVFGSLEMSVAVQGQNSDCIGAELLAGRGHP